MEKKHENKILFKIPDINGVKATEIDLNSRTARTMT